ncbi:MAG: hypothetical protein Kow0090_00390 [Myxococcota bacterium]
MKKILLLFIASAKYQFNYDSYALTFHNLRDFSTEGRKLVKRLKELKRETLGPLYEIEILG